MFLPGAVYLIQGGSQIQDSKADDATVSHDLQLALVTKGKSGVDCDVRKYSLFQLTVEV